MRAPRTMSVLEAGLYRRAEALVTRGEALLAEGPTGQGALRSELEAWAGELRALEAEPMPACSLEREARYHLEAILYELSYRAVRELAGVEPRQA